MCSSEVRTAAGWVGEPYPSPGAQLIERMARNSHVHRKKTSRMEHDDEMPLCSPRAGLLWIISGFWLEKSLICLCRTLFTCSSLSPINKLPWATASNAAQTQTQIWEGFSVWLLHGFLLMIKIHNTKTLQIINISYMKLQIQSYLPKKKKKRKVRKTMKS